MPKTSLGKTKVSLATVIIVISLVATAVAVYWTQTEDPNLYQNDFNLINNK